VSRQRLEYGQALEQRLKDFEKAWAGALERDEKARKMLAQQSQELAEAQTRLAALDDRRRADCQLLESRIEEERRGREAEMARAAANDARAKDAELKLAESKSLSVRKDHEIRLQASRIEALRLECDALQGVLLSEKTGFKEIADRVTEELQKVHAIEDFDTSLLEDLAEASQVRTIEAGSPGQSGPVPPGSFR
jgi:hypothetical protein